MIVVMVMVMMVIILRFLSRLQVFEGFVWGMDEEGNSGMKKNLLDKGKGERERKKNIRHKTRQTRNPTCPRHGEKRACHSSLYSR